VTSAVTRKKAQQLLESADRKMHEHPAKATELYEQALEGLGNTPDESVLTYTLLKRIAYCCGLTGDREKMNDTWSKILRLAKSRNDDEAYCLESGTYGFQLMMLGDYGAAVHPVVGAISSGVRLQRTPWLVSDLIAAARLCLDKTQEPDARRDVFQAILTRSLQKLQRSDFARPPGSARPSEQEIAQLIFDLRSAGLGALADDLQQAEFEARGN
jgi:hypothetical protein